MGSKLWSLGVRTVGSWNKDRGVVELELWSGAARAVELWSHGVTILESWTNNPGSRGVTIKKES